MVELDKLIKELEAAADGAAMNELPFTEMTCRKAAEVIKLMYEFIVEEDNEKRRRMIDDIGDFNNGTEET